MEIGLLFRKVRDTVFSDTDGQQEPFTYGSLPAEALFFKSAAQKWFAPCSPTPQRRGP